MFLTEDDDVEEGESGKVTVTINPSTGYQVISAPNHEAEVLVMDNDIPPEITIARISENSIVEGATATFRISVDQVLENDLEITMTLDISGGFENYISSVDFTEIIPAGQTYLDFPIPTTVNNIDESTKIVKVTLKPATAPSDYRVGTANSAQIDVLDSDLPEISIRGGTEVTEGNTAQFFIVADIARQSDLIISYSISAGDGNFINPNQPSNGTVTLTHGNSSIQAELLISTLLDSTDEIDGEIIATLEDDTNAIATYRISETLNEAAVVVRDINVPVISVIGGDAIVENTDAEFTFSADIVRDRIC